MTVPILVPLYKSNDERIETDLEPLVYEEWTSAKRDQPEDAQWFSVIKRASSLVNGLPVAAKTRKPFQENAAVMDIQFADGRTVFVRVLPRHDQDRSTERWKHARLFAELSVLRWLEANAPDLSVPRVLAFHDATNLLVTTLMPGLDAEHAYPLLSSTAKECSVTSWARVSVRMFRLSAPQRFGMLHSVQESPIPAASYLSISPGHTFDIDEGATLLSFFTSAISSRRTRSITDNSAEAHAMLCKRLDRLLEGLKPLIALAQDTPFMSRFAFTHSDLRPGNIMLDEVSGEVVGIVDWEFNASMPACMSVGYPSWIRPPIIESYHNPKHVFVNFQNEPKGERNRLCDLYEQAVKQLDEECHSCLILGTRLRDALVWIECFYSDLDGAAMESWTEEHLFDASVTNHRCA